MEKAKNEIKFCSTIKQKSTVCLTVRVKNLSADFRVKKTDFSIRLFFYLPLAASVQNKQISNLEHKFKLRVKPFVAEIQPFITLKLYLNKKRFPSALI